MTLNSGTVSVDGDCVGSGSKTLNGLAERYSELAVKADRYDPAALVNKGNDTHRACLKHLYRRRTSCIRIFVT